MRRPPHTVRVLWKGIIPLQPLHPPGDTDAPHLNSQSHGMIRPGLLFRTTGRFLPAVRGVEDAPMVDPVYFRRLGRSEILCQADTS